jgi:hypothetical protein
LTIILDVTTVDQLLPMLRTDQGKDLFTIVLHRYCCGGPVDFATLRGQLDGRKQADETVYRIKMGAGRQSE